MSKYIQALISFFGKYHVLQNDELFLFTDRLKIDCGNTKFKRKTKILTLSVFVLNIDFDNHMLL